MDGRFDDLYNTIFDLEHRMIEISHELDEKIDKQKENFRILQNKISEVNDHSNLLHRKIEAESNLRKIEKELENEAEKKEKVGICSSNIIICFYFFICTLIMCFSVTFNNTNKIEETPNEIKVNLDNPQNKDIILNINHE